MRKFTLLPLLVSLAATTGCFTEPSQRHEPVTLYARKNGVVLNGTQRTLRYGQKVRFDWCNPATCFLDVDGVQVTVVRSDLIDLPPPPSPQFVVGVSGVSAETPVEIEAYEPKTSEVRIKGNSSLLPLATLRDHRETAEERAERLRTEASDRVQAATRARQQAKEEREASRLAMEEAKKREVETAGDRRAFGRQLRDNYLASGANIKVTVSGTHATEIRLEYALIDDVWLYQFQHNDEVMSALRGKGFTSLVLSDGFEYAMRLNL